MTRLTLGSCCIAFGTVVSACAPEPDASRQGPAGSPPTVVSLSTANYTFQAPDTIRAGWITFRFANNGDEIHYAHIVRLDSGRTVPELVEAYAEAIRTSGPRPKWVTRFGGPGGTAPADSSAVTEYLEPGSYVWICPVEDSAGNPHFGKGEHKTFVVRAADDAAAGKAPAPTATTEIRLRDFSFAFDSTLRAGMHTIRVVNTGVEPHDLVLMKLAAGRTLEDVRTWLNPERARRPDQAKMPPPAVESLGTLARGIAAIAPGMEGFIDAHLPPGEYVLFCMATAPDGRSHIEHGMIQQVAIK